MSSEVDSPIGSAWESCMILVLLMWFLWLLYCIVRTSTCDTLTVAAICEKCDL